MSVLVTIKSNVDRLILGSGNYKYTAILKNGRRVNFGHSDYQQYKDTVPKNLGGGKWSSKNHLDPERRRSYRSRHGAISTKTGQSAYTVKLSPAWFSYYLLW